MAEMSRPAAALAVAVSLSLLACNLSSQLADSGAAATSLAKTQAAGQTSTAAVLAAAGTLAEGLAPSSTPTPAFTATPTLTATPSETPSVTPTPTLSIPIGSLTQNTNCRKGPLAVYDLIRTLMLGDTVQLIGRDAAGEYWYVTDPSQPGKDCWLWGRYVDISGDTFGVPVFTPPPTPTPSFVWAGDWLVWANASPGKMSLKQNGSSVTGSWSDLTVLGLTGTTSEGGRTLSGSINGVSPTVTFVLRMSSNMNQFTGHYTDGGTKYAWCGARNGASRPASCMGP